MLNNNYVGILKILVKKLLKIHRIVIVFLFGRFLQLVFIYCKYCSQRVNMIFVIVLSFDNLFSFHRTQVVQIRAY